MHFAICMSDAAYDSLEQGEEELRVGAEGKLTAINFQFSSFLFMLSLNSILQLQVNPNFQLPLKRIPAVYPACSGCTILPRQAIEGLP